MGEIYLDLEKNDNYKKKSCNIILKIIEVVFGFIFIEVALLAILNFRNIKC